MADVVFTGREEIYNGYNRELFFTTDTPKADPTNTTAKWIQLGYDDSFSFDENENETQKYNKRDKSHKKKGRKEYTFDISQMYAGVQYSIFMLKGKNGTLKQVTKNDEGQVVEVNYFHNCDINSPKFAGGGDDKDDTISASGSYENRFLYDKEGTGAALLFATDGSHMVTP
ncbi:hypothetical protein vBBak6_032 [Bacillus phage v_B-Bak6]|uniref:Uncharacterized protein n=2 Tax=root TaxID=1 RepID=S5MLT7_9CAUD|nr:hypothetical protein PP653_gp127 [Bacillus phage Basilisk]AGR46585.1 hypothetical protein BASILISK_40 [Bacillus phage Basilisk]AXY82992.1 hypothetical protein vBBak1_032 [Bacillus phage v_B-Bak1]AXY83112.1 hypothetical protein vBBak6_032 [Bacillus phage v_B-Bak6]